MQVGMVAIKVINATIPSIDQGMMECRKKK
jgi:hypothetical protein